MANSAPVNEPEFQLRADSPWQRLALHRVPQRYLLISAFVSYCILAIGYLEGTTIWVAFGLALAPWVVMALVEVEWSYKHFGWFALFSLMAFVQLIHYSEHCIEVVQYHIFHDSLKDSTAIFSKFNTEGVHLAGDSFLTLGTILLLMKFPRNPWLWVAIPFQLAHQAEHTFLGFMHWVEGAKQGAPGLLAKGGAINGGLPLVRPDLHWIYNTLYTIPFVLALIYQLRRTYDEALDEAFVGAAHEDLVEAAHHLETLHFMRGQTILAPGEDVERLYIITDGEAEVYTHDKKGAIKEVARLRKGQYIGEVGLLLPGVPHTKTVRAVTDVTALGMDEPTFRHLMERSTSVAEHMHEVAEEHVVKVPAARKPSNGNGKVAASSGRAQKATAEKTTTTRRRPS